MEFLSSARRSRQPSVSSTKYFVRKKTGETHVEKKPIRGGRDDDSRRTTRNSDDNDKYGGPSLREHEFRRPTLNDYDEYGRRVRRQHTFHKSTMGHYADDEDSSRDRYKFRGTKLGDEDHYGGRTSRLAHRFTTPDEGYGPRSTRRHNLRHAGSDSNDDDKYCARKSPGPRLRRASTDSEDDHKYDGRSGRRQERHYAAHEDNRSKAQGYYHEHSEEAEVIERKPKEYYQGLQVIYADEVEEPE